MALGSARVALAHDWLNQAGGAESVLATLQAWFPSAPIYTTIHAPDAVPESRAWDVRASWMDRLPGIHANHQPYLPIYPLAWSTTRARAADGGDADLVLSNKSAFCHGLRTGSAVHVCYCLTPTRFVWEPDAYLAHEQVPGWSRPILRALIPWLRRWDHAAAQRVDHLVAISSVVRDRIARYYGRDSVVIHPPADVAAFTGQRGAAPEAGAGAEPYHVVLARLVPYKRIDVAITAFNHLGRRLVVIGDGRDRARLEALAGPTITFRGRLPQGAVRHLVARSEGLIWPGVEDYGLVPVEAMAAGRPVIAQRAGGVLDTVVEGQTGMFFDGDDPVALAAAVRAADAIDWNAGAISAHAERFGRAPFDRRLAELLERALADRAEAGGGRGEPGEPGQTGHIGHMGRMGLIGHVGQPRANRVVAGR